MSRYEELYAVAREHNVRCHQFYFEANAFPEKLRVALRAHLEAPEWSIRLCSIRHEGLPPLTLFDRGDEDHDGCFHFAVAITLHDAILIAPWLRFKPIPCGYEVFVPDRMWAYRADYRSSRFQIINDAGWQPLLDELVKICREALLADPFEKIGHQAFVGFASPSVQN